MYTVDTDLKDLRIKDRVISKLYFSMNSPQIATPELGTEEALCYIMLFKAGNSYSSYIGLYLPSSDRRFYYAYSGNPFTEDRLNEVMEESSQFAEEMGFLVDELKLSGMSVDERNRWIEEQQFFGYTKKAEEKPRDVPAGMGEERPPEAASAEEGKPEQPVAASGTAPAPSPEVSAPAEEQSSSPPPPPPLEPVQEAVSPAPTPDIMMDPPVKAPPAEEPVLPVQPVPKRSSGRQKSMKAAPSSPVAEVDEDEVVDETQPVHKHDTPAREQKRQKKGQPSSTGTVNKEYEALARLLASF